MISIPILAPFGVSAELCAFNSRTTASLVFLRALPLEIAVREEKHFFESRD